MANPSTGPQLPECHKFVFTKDFTAVQFQELQTPPTDTTNRTFNKGTILTACVKVDFEGSNRVVTEDGYDVTDAVDLVKPAVQTPTPVQTLLNEPTFSNREKNIIIFSLVIVVIIVIVMANK